VLSEFIGAVIGKKGQMIRTITTDSKVSRLVLYTLELLLIN